MSMIHGNDQLSFGDDNAPISLLDQCFRFIVQQLYTICSLDISTNLYELNEGLVLPRELCEKLVHFYDQNAGAFGIDDKFVNIFKNTDVTSLKRVCLRNSIISDQGLKVLLQHKLIELDLEKCKEISENSLPTLNQFGESLLYLTIGAGVNLLTSNLDPPPFNHDFHISKGQAIYPIINAPKLRKLAIRSFEFVSKDQLYFDSLFFFIPQLAHLDLSGCSGIESLSFLTHLKSLVFLVLHNIAKVQDGLSSICELKNLRHLDISQSSDKIRTFQNENDTLAKIVESLPNLVSLDISGTNLAGTGIAETMLNCDRLCDIPGLNSRINTPLEFLGLYGTQYGACRRHDIPAKKVSGDANEAQILNAARAYIDRPEVLQRVLNDLYHLFRYAHCQNIQEALSVILDAMDRHLTEKHMQISGSASLFYIVKDKEIPPFPARVKRMVITTLLNGMNAHGEEDTMMRNGCLILCQFKIPQDVLFEYERLVLMLLHIVSDMEQEGFVQRIGIYLLNSLACQVDNYQKQLLGDLTIIQIMLKLIHDRLNRTVCDDVLEVAWSTMWNVTDETPINCKRFLDSGGMDYFLKCLKLFPDKEELMRNMMGLLGNVAEVRNLRPRLMTRSYIEVFVSLVSSHTDGIEVSYNAAGALSHLASDGPEAWKNSGLILEELPPRDEVLQKMITAINNWDLNSERMINYRSFEPILKLARVRHTPACQLWAIWALANLTRVYPDKYCSLVEAEGGFDILNEILSDDSSHLSIKALATQVVGNCQKFKSDRIDKNPQLELDG